MKVKGVGPKLSRSLAFFSLLGLSLMGACSGGDSPVGDNNGGAFGSGGTLAGGGEGGMVETLELVSTFPEMGSKNASAYEPIELRFSLSLEEGSVKDAITVQASGKEIVPQVTVKGKTVFLALPALSLPATVSISIASSLRATTGATFVGDSLTLNFPIWHDGSAELTVPSSASLVFDAKGALYVFSADGADIALRKYEQGGWVEVSRHGGTAGATAGVVASGLDASGLWVVRTEKVGAQTSVFLSRLAKDAFVPSETGALRSGAGLLVAAASATNGEPVIATALGNSVIAHGLSENADGVVDSAAFTAPNAPTVLAVTDDGSFAPYVAFDEADGDLEVIQFGSGAPGAVGDAIERSLDDRDARPSLTLEEGAPLLLFRDGDEVSSHFVVKKFAGAWAFYGPALDIELDAAVSEGRIFPGEDGEPTVTWVEERGADGGVIHLATFDAGEVVPRIYPAARRVPFSGIRTSVALDELGRAAVLFWTSKTVGLSLENGRSLRTKPTAGAPGVGGCSLPKDAVPATLTATGCYESVSARRWIPEAIPYGINSILWSDGAYKRRGILLPEGTSLDFATADAFGAPVGTIIVKEFWVERAKGDPTSRFIVETRFLVKRCAEGSCAEPWTGYSYQWNSAGSEATLLPGEDAETRVDWDVTETGVSKKHTHIYPGRTACTTCHNEAAGRLLGISAPQFDHAFDDGERVENLLAAWAGRGLFGDSVTTPDPVHPETGTTRLPSPPDVSFGLEARVRGYFQSNCAHCHRPGGVQTNPDFRYFGTGLVASGNICDLIVPGDHSSAIGGKPLGGIYERDASRELSNKMPPLASDLPDDRQLKVTAAWIDSLSSCP